MSRAVDLTGQRFERLTVLSRAGTAPGRIALWLCQCDCGSEKVVRSQCLRSGDTTSCGCKTRELNKTRGAKHGGKQEAEAEYRAWMNLSTKEGRPTEWDDFVQFFCDVGEKPSPRHQLCRKDITKPHGPTNTYWRNPDDYAELTQRNLTGEFFLDMRAFA